MEVENGCRCFRPELWREILMNPDVEEAKHSVDAAISLARRLNAACKYKHERIYWLVETFDDLVAFFCRGKRFPAGVSVFLRG
jgi:hypothetical protein